MGNPYLFQGQPNNVGPVNYEKFILLLIFSFKVLLKKQLKFCLPVYNILEFLTLENVLQILAFHVPNAGTNNMHNILPAYREFCLNKSNKNRPF
jgi:hypothetical protein